MEALFVQPVADFQNYLSRMQEIPVLGPILISPTKMVVSVAETIASLVVGIFAAFGNYITETNDLTIRAYLGASSAHFFIGITQLASALFNMCTLGVMAESITKTGHVRIINPVGTIV